MRVHCWTTRARAKDQSLARTTMELYLLVILSRQLLNLILLVYHQVVVSSVWAPKAMRICSLACATQPAANTYECLPQTPSQMQKGYSLSLTPNPQRIRSPKKWRCQFLQQPRQVLRVKRNKAICPLQKLPLWWRLPHARYSRSVLDRKHTRST